MAPRGSLEVLQFYFGNSPRLELACRPAELEVRFRGESWTTSWRVRVRVQPPLRLVVTGEQRPSFPLWRGLPLRPQSAPLVRALDYLYVGLRPPFGYDTELLWCRVRGAMRRAYEALRKHAIRLIDAADPTARHVALRFPPCMHWFVYRTVLSDRTGHLAQVATTCPGLLTLAFLFEEDATPWHTDRVLDAVVEGRRLNAVLDLAVETWAQAARERREGLLPPPWTRLDEPGVLAAQRLLFRRAPAGLAPRLLWMMPPVALAPEDIPLAPRAAARYFRAMKVPPLLVPGLRATEATQRALALLVSRHGADLQRRLQWRSRRTWARMLADLSDYLVAVGRVPSRRTDPRRLFAESRAWHRAHLPEGAAAGRHRRPLLPDETPLSDPPYPAWEQLDQGGVIPVAEIVPLRTVGELRREGEEMNHCVGTYSGAAVAGACSIYRATIYGRRLTIELARAADGWRLAQARGPHNREPTRKEREVLRAWRAAVSEPPGRLTP